MKKKNISKTTTTKIENEEKHNENYISIRL